MYRGLFFGILFAAMTLTPVGLAFAADATSVGVVSCNSAAGIGSTACNFCAMVRLAQNIVNFAIVISIPIAMLFIGWAGFLYMTSAYSPAQIATAHKIFRNTALGFVAVLCSWLIVNTIIHEVVLRFNSGYFSSIGGTWYKVPECAGARATDKMVNELLRGVFGTGVPSAPGTAGSSLSTDSAGVPVATSGIPNTDGGARSQFAANGIQVSSSGSCSDRSSASCTSLDGLQQTAVLGSIQLKQNCGCTLVISGGTETGHSESGTYTHGSGYKLDYSANGTIDSYMTSWNSVGTRSDGARQYQSGNTVCAREASHWDCTFK